MTKIIRCTKCQGEGYDFKTNLITLCPKCDGEGAVKVSPLHPVAEYFLFSQPWRWLLLRVTDFLPGDWRKRLCERLYPSEPKLCRDCTHFLGCVAERETGKDSGAARCDYYAEPCTGCHGEGCNACHWTGEQDPAGRIREGENAQ